MLQEINSVKEQNDINIVLETILKSKTFESIFLNRCFKHQQELLTKVIRGDHFDTGDNSVKHIIDNYFSNPPYTTAYTVVLLKLNQYKPEKIK